VLAVIPSLTAPQADSDATHGRLLPGCSGDDDTVVGARKLEKTAVESE
jgi:hypothetical protein